MSSMEQRMARRLGKWLGALTWMLAAVPFAGAQQPPKSFVIHEAPMPVGAIRFADGQGRVLSLADFRGKVVLLNVWATWCAPCRTEIPALAHLNAELGGAELAVVAVSIDHGGIESVRRLLAELGTHNLEMYIDTSGQVMRTVRAIGLPTSLVIDREGRELGRISGAAEWDAPETIEFLQHVVNASPQ
jgi:thiol-disulfide isomerase/thioredoxin